MKCVHRRILSCGHKLQEDRLLMTWMKVAWGSFQEAYIWSHGIRRNTLFELRLAVAERGEK